MESRVLIAESEIHKTLYFCDLCSTRIGLSFLIGPSTIIQRLSMYFVYAFSCISLFLLLVAQAWHYASLVINTTSIDEFVSGLHILGYGVMSMAKMLTLWFKKNSFRQRISELAEIWPVHLQDKDSDEIKTTSLSALKVGQFSFFMVNVLGVLFYIVTPLIIYLYKHIRGIEQELGTIWHATYPFEKSKPFNIASVYIFEAYSGSVSVLSMLGSDLLFCTMSSHISMLLRILQVNIRNLAKEKNGRNRYNIDCYEDIVSVIKIHQRLISYSIDLEETFSLVNLINVLLSSVNICCVVFTIVLLDPWMEMSNKIYLAAVLTQVGIICWYADDIYRASLGVADAVYECGWYKSNIRCRRVLLVLIQRSQKPLYFTAMKFQSITLATYGSILGTAYSYFTLLCTSYQKN